jgi:thiamine biosynthesis lipoprotein
MIKQIEFKAMGCHMMAALDNSSLRTKERLQQVPVWFEAWEQILSRFRENSELSQLNHIQGVPVVVSQILWTVFQACVEAEKTSNGLVTPTILEALMQAGYTDNFADLPNTEMQSSPSAEIIACSMSEISWDKANKTICLPPGVHLDFGGIAKGWAADQAVQRLKIYGPALVNAGGDIAISGLMNKGQTWPVSVVDPFQPENDLEMLQLGHCGVATSGIDYRRWLQEGAWKHHIIDPRTSMPAVTDLISVTVIAPSTQEAEVAAKVVLISGSQAGISWLETKPGLEGILVLQNGDRLYSQGVNKYLWRT